MATDLEQALALANEAVGSRLVNVLGADVARQCLEVGLLDEVHVYVALVLLGDGVPLFVHEGGRAVRLRPSEEPSFGGLRFAVVR